MALTSIQDQKTPGRPIEITFAAETGIPSANQEVLLIGHENDPASPTSGTIPAYVLAQINNAGDPVAGAAEANTKFGPGSELAKMVIAAIAANAGNSNVPTLKCIALASTDTDFGPADAALVTAQNVKAEFIVSPYDGAVSTALTTKIKLHAQLVSGAQRVENNQFGSAAVVVNRTVTDPSTLPVFDTQYVLPIWVRDTGSRAYSIGEDAAAAAAVIAGNVIPFNPLDNVTVGSMPAPASQADYISVGASLESEVALGKGWTPMRVKPNGEVAFVRVVTSRITVDGTVAATAYYDMMDFQVLYFWRKTLFSRFNQPDLKQVKASQAVAQDMKSEMVRLANIFEEQNMFQAVAQLAKQFVVQRSASDRHRFDYLTPVNVIPGLHVAAGNIQATTQFDSFSV